MADYKKIFINNKTDKIKEMLDHLITIRIIDHITTNFEVGNTNPVMGNKFELYDDNNRLLFSMTWAKIIHTDGSEDPNGTGWMFTVYNLDSSLSYRGTGASSSGNNGYFLINNAYICKNGIFFLINTIEFTSTNTTTGGCGIITMNQDRIPVFDIVLPYSSQVFATDGSVIKNAMAREMLIAPTDDTPLDFTYYSAPIAINQCILVPFFTFSQIGTVSYTPYAGRFIACNISSFIIDDYLHLISFNNAQWITNGYWALQI